MIFEIKLDGVPIVRKTIEKFIDTFEFKENVSEEYKSGFYDFGKAVINMLSKIDDERTGEE